ncbi:MAG: MFS transporter [Anaerolineales bacterium]|nr:MFS transporter [Anaerolineales bacterium]
MLFQLATQTDDRSISLLRNAPLRQILLGQLATLAAAYAVYISSIALIEEKTQSSAQMGLMIFSLILPGFIFGMIAGVVVDKYDRKRVLVVSNVGCLFIAAGLVSAMGWLENLTLLLVIVYIGNFIIAALLQFIAASRDATFPHLVSNEELLPANSVLKVVILAGQGLGAALLSPLLLQIGDSALVFVVSTALLALATWQYARLPNQTVDDADHEDEHHTQRLSLIWDDLKAGWSFIVHDAALGRAIGYLVLLTTFMLMISTCLPGVASRTWGIPIEFLPYLAVPGGVGFGLGLWLVGKHGHQLGNEEWVSVGMVSLGVGLALMTFMQEMNGPYILLFLIVSVASGAGAALIVTTTRAIIMDRSPDAIRGRVIAAQLFLASIAATITLPFIGGFVDVVNFRSFFAFLALITLGAGVLSVGRSLWDRKDMSWKRKIQH